MVRYEPRLVVQKQLNIASCYNQLPTAFHDLILILEAKRFPIVSAISAVTRIEKTLAVPERWSSFQVAYQHPDRDPRAAMAFTPFYQHSPTFDVRARLFPACTGSAFRLFGVFLSSGEFQRV